MNMEYMYQPHKVKKLLPIDNNVIVADMNFEMRTTSMGIYLPSDDGKNSGIRPRWAQVYAVGPNQQDVRVGQWILVSHGRWTRGVKIEDDNGVHTIRKIDVNEILAVSDEPVYDDTMSDKVV